MGPTSTRQVPWEIAKEKPVLREDNGRRERRCLETWGQRRPSQSEEWTEARQTCPGVSALLPETWKV